MDRHSLVGSPLIRTPDATRNRPVTQTRTAALLMMAMLPLAGLAGCASCQNCEEPLACYSFRHHGPSYFGPMMCFGYHSTCWRAWPEECPPCPPYTLTPGLAEPVGPPLPEATQENTPLPPPGDVPLPTPAVPSPSDRGYYSSPEEESPRPIHFETGYASQPVRLAPPESH
jgi:hypothetical protein